MLGTTIGNVGGYYNPTPQLSILFSAGHSVGGQNHAVSYFATYYTFPKAAPEEKKE